MRSRRCAGRECTVVRGGARAQGRAERQGERAAVVILPGRNRQRTGAGGTRRRSGADVEVAEDDRWDTDDNVNGDDCGSVRTGVGRGRCERRSR